MEKEDKLYISKYNDYYGGMLTKYQSQLISMYYDEDLSLNEIANQLGISPQGVRDALKRAENTLEKMESKLMLVKKVDSAKILLESLISEVPQNKQDEIKKVLDLLDK